MRKLLELDPAIRFVGVATENEKQDVVARSGGAADGTAALREALGEAWQSLVETPEVLDRIAEIVTFRNDETTIRERLIATGLASPIVERLMMALAEGKLKELKGAGHISAKAARAILPHLAQGMVYSEACAEAGYDHARSRVTLPLMSTASAAWKRSASCCARRKKPVGCTHCCPIRSRARR